ncbi:DUF3068 domain-containing protein [Aeromicrobium fastidiosum]|uniref:DUF3068 domain-containing protein n=1 Tax=Aeromicrobium fastidiosum TaxID=52699 RepID=UPI0020234BAA|nr:DUF3068 domain-containing protein [Aeromicrobium fastidiosum]MCL8250271.1 DUF3068 domain-containing protein [Aeromicrobium fastidiosum]
MGKKLGTVALFLGAFVLALAVLSKFYMYDRLAVVPLNTETTSISETAPGQDGTYLDIAGGLRVAEAPLKSTRIVSGDVEASKKASDELGKDVAVWDTYVCTAPAAFDCSSGETPLSASDETVAFDRQTGEVVAWEGNTSSSDGETEKDFPFKGQYFKFPFDTQKKTYQFWDGTLNKATPATYDGEGTVDGLKVLKFKQTIAPVKTGTIDVPGSLVGRPDEGTVTADRIYSNVRTFSVEPVTGVIVVGGEAQDGYLELDGERVLTTTKATLQYTESNTKDTVDEYKPKATLLTAVKTYVPIGGAVLGIVLIGVGLLARRSGNAAGTRRSDDPELVESR